LQRIDQSTARPIVAIKSVQIQAGDQKRGDAPTVISDTDFSQMAAAAQQKCAFEQIGDFNGTFQKDLTSFQVLDFFGQMR
jgi:hypothetical protein